MKFLAGFLAGLVLVVAAAGVVIYSGWYNIAATKPHYEPIRWALHTTMHNSVRAHAEGMSVPPLSEADAEKGLKHFRQMCVVCHGAPGVAPAEIGKGLRPKPPPLSQAVQDWNAAELFWIVKHGLKMTGMPAWGPTHKDEDLWAVVAFLQKLPGMTPEAYEALGASGTSGGDSQEQAR